MTDGTNQREFTRVPVHVVVQVKAGGPDAIRGRLEDVSLKGLFVSCDATYPVGTACTIELSLDAGEQAIHMDARGTVMRADASGMAIEFEAVDADSFDHLRNLVLYNAADTEQVEDEFDDSVGIKRMHRGE
ncbi:MAG: PilZ domain-containing protein [Candidatus Hydrogenedentes bacterium]|nr:PilZ domain-containing protein [Candidatus Hydrogenedentota bacterium]